MENTNPPEHFPGQNQGNVVFTHPVQQGHGPQKTGTQMLPKSIGSMVSGILAVSLMFAYGIGGIICGIIALSMARKAQETYDQDPDGYKPFCLTFVKTGKITGLIGLIGGCVILVGVICLIAYLVANNGRL